jgi:hypothetical protein
MRIHIGLVALAASLALIAAGAPAAGAARNTGGLPVTTDAGPLMKVDMSGVARNGKKFDGTFGVYKFVAKNGRLWAVGTVRGKLGKRSVRRGNVMMPAQLTGDSNTANTAQTGGNCTVLHLVLGPVNLNLLGLKVTLGGGAQANQPIVLDITAERGGGLPVTCSAV